MIKFFRHIRKSLIEQNKMGKPAFAAGRYFKYAIGEIILVIIGILLALQINNWNENRKTKQQIAATLLILKEEITTNKANIKNVQAYHIMVKDTLSNIDIPKTDVEIPKILGFWRGMQTPRLQNAAFQTTIQTGLSKEINTELLKALNQLYTLQESYNSFGTSSLQIFQTVDFSDIKNFKRIMSSISIIMTDLYYFEIELNQLFDKTLALIE